MSKPKTKQSITLTSIKENIAFIKSINDKLQKKSENEKVVKKSENEKVVKKSENEKVVKKSENEKVVKKSENEKVVKKSENESEDIDKNIKIENIISLNKGEMGEIYTIKSIFLMIQNNKIDTLKKIFGEDASEGITLHDINDKKEITKIEEIKKTKSTSKADCIIKFVKTNKFMNISIKCMHGAMPALLNHTPRNAKVFKEGGILNKNLEKLDNLISMMNKERTDGNVGEDIQISKTFPSLNEDIKKNIIEVVKYFMFEGTGSGNSQNPVNSILEIYEPNNIEKWKFINCEDDKNKIDYIESQYDKLILSLRDKGMPKNNNTICEPWIFYQKKDSKKKSKQKGSLHIRLKK